ncbi:MAG: J domain-containing protein, partial [Polyangiaceae bacterium]
AIARAIATRTTGTLCLESKEGVRRVVMREGDLVTAASGVDDESLIAFLVEHGDLPRESLQALAGRFATFGRHAGAALVAQGYLRQDQLWPVLRAHAEWILGRALAIDSGTALMEPDAPGRLKAEPSVFGGSTGAEVFVDVVRRVISQDDAFARMGGGQARIGEGRNANLLTECALGAPEIAVLEQLRGLTLAQAVASAPDTDMIAVLYALHLLGVIEVLRSLGGAVPSSRDRSNEPRIDTLDDEAIRARIRARLDLVEEGDYFAVLGVARTATSYEVRRAFTELRRAFDPDRILTPSMVDLGPQVRKIVAVLEEAYDILHDSARRDRYRRAIDTMN